MKVKLTLRSTIIFDYFRLQQKDPECLKRIRDEFRYKNPKYTDNQIFGYSNHGVPEYLNSYRVDKNKKKIYISRGTLKRLKELLKDYGHKVEVIDKRLIVPKVDWHTPKCNPRDDQPEFIKLFKKDKDGILLAYTSFGKSLSTLMAIRELGYPALILVHTTFYQKQWLMEATNPKLFNMPKDEIGGVGGIFSKRKFGKINICLYHSLCKPHHLKFFKDRVGIFVQDEVQKAPIEACQKVVNKVPAKIRKGMSAEIARKDGKEFLTLDAFGPVLKKWKEKDSKSKILSKVYIIETPFEDPDYEWDKRRPEMESRASKSKTRNKIILSRTLRKLKAGKIVLIIVPRKYQAARLCWKLRKKYKVQLLIGNINKKKDIPKKANDEVVNIMQTYDHAKAFDICKSLGEKKELDVIIGTQKAEVGLSISTIDHIVVGSMVTGDLERLNQIKGRTERTYSEEQVQLFGHEKPRPTIDILWDKNISTFKDDASAIRQKYKGTKTVKYKR